MQSVSRHLLAALVAEAAAALAGLLDVATVAEEWLAAKLVWESSAHFRPIHLTANLLRWL
jgi:hypothetical protein